MLFRYEKRKCKWKLGQGCREGSSGLSLELYYASLLVLWMELCIEDWGVKSNGVFLRSCQQVPHNTAPVH